jgi:hypothetical protein
MWSFPCPAPFAAIIAGFVMAGYVPAIPVWLPAWDNSKYVYARHKTKISRLSAVIPGRERNRMTGSSIPVVIRLERAFRLHTMLAGLDRSRGRRERNCNSDCYVAAATTQAVSKYS